MKRNFEEIFKDQVSITTVRSKLNGDVWTTEGSCRIVRTMDGENWEEISAGVKFMDKDFVTTIQAVGNNIAEQLYELDITKAYKPTIDLKFLEE